MRDEAYYYNLNVQRSVEFSLKRFEPPPMHRSEPIRLPDPPKYEHSLRGSDPIDSLPPIMRPDYLIWDK